jgi:hypothetical protein
MLRKLILLFAGFSMSFLPAQKIYFSGLGFKGMVTNEVINNQENLAFLEKSSVNLREQREIRDIRQSGNYQFGKNNRQVCFLGLDCFLRFSGKKQWLQWAEWTIGAGFTLPSWAYQSNDFYYFNPWNYVDSVQRRYKLLESKHSGMVLESKLLFNSSPFKSRLMKYAGFGMRGGLFQQKGNRAEIKEWDMRDTSFSLHQTIHTNMPSTLLGIFGTIGLKYNISCLFSVYSDINIGYYNPQNQKSDFLKRKVKKILFIVV